MHNLRVKRSSRKSTRCSKLKDSKIQNFSEVSTSSHPCLSAFLSAFSIVRRMKDRGFPLCRVEIEKGLSPLIVEDLSDGSGKFEIQRYPAKWMGYQVLGALVRYPEKAVIHYSLSLNTCWRRFVVTKEMAHLIIDKCDSFTNDPVQLVTDLIADMSLADDPSAQFASEKIAGIAATGILLPHLERGNITSMRDEGASARKIATVYRVPAVAVELFLSPGYTTIEEKCWDMFSKQS